MNGTKIDKNGQKLSSILENRKILIVKVGKYIYNDTNILPIKVSLEKLN
jgi:hypothetical protein